MSFEHVVGGFTLFAVVVAFALIAGGLGRAGRRLFDLAAGSEALRKRGLSGRKPRSA